jgi:hypothetical protein
VHGAHRGVHEWCTAVHVQVREVHARARMCTILVHGMCTIFSLILENVHVQVSTRVVMCTDLIFGKTAGHGVEDYCHTDLGKLCYRTHFVTLRHDAPRAIARFHW